MTPTIGSQFEHSPVRQKATKCGPDSACRGASQASCKKACVFAPYSPPAHLHGTYTCPTWLHWPRHQRPHLHQWVPGFAYDALPCPQHPVEQAAKDAGADGHPVRHWVAKPNERDQGDSSADEDDRLRAGSSTACTSAAVGAAKQLEFLGGCRCTWTGCLHQLSSSVGHCAPQKSHLHRSSFKGARGDDTACSLRGTQHVAHVWRYVTHGCFWQCRLVIVKFASAVEVCRSVAIGGYRLQVCWPVTVGGYRSEGHSVATAYARAHLWGRVCVHWSLITRPTGMEWKSTRCFLFSALTTSNGASGHQAQQIQQTGPAASTTNAAPCVLWCWRSSPTARRCRTARMRMRPPAARWAGQWFAHPQLRQGAASPPRSDGPAFMCVRPLSEHSPCTRACMWMLVHTQLRTYALIHVAQILKKTWTGCECKLFL